MSGQQAPVRPWFRLAPMARPAPPPPAISAAPGPATATAPTAAPARPTFIRPTLPFRPPTTLPILPSEPVPPAAASPTPPTAAAVTAPAAASQPPPAAPAAALSPPHAAPAVPTTITSSTVQETKVTTPPPNGNLQGYVGETRSPTTTYNGKKEASEDMHTKEKAINKKFSDSEDLGTSIITLAGENKGAIMELSPSHKKYDFGNNPRIIGKEGQNDGKKSGSDSDSRGSSGGGKSSKTEKNHKVMEMQSPPMTAFVNSDVQSINNSILYDCSCTQNDPGVHLLVSRKASGGQGLHLKNLQKKG